VQSEHTTTNSNEEGETRVDTAHTLLLTHSSAHTHLLTSTHLHTHTHTPTLTHTPTCIRTKRLPGGTLTRTHRRFRETETERDIVRLADRERTLREGNAVVGCEQRTILLYMGRRRRRRRR
jgi:hypothetical protein